MNFLVISVSGFCGGFCALLASSCAGYAGEVEEVVVDTCLVKTHALDQDVLGQIAFVHEAEGLVVSCFDADGDAVVAGVGGYLLFDYM